MFPSVYQTFLLGIHFFAPQPHAPKITNMSSLDDPHSQPEVHDDDGASPLASAASHSSAWDAPATPRHCGWAGTRGACGACGAERGSGVEGKKGRVLELGEGTRVGSVYKRFFLLFSEFLLCLSTVFFEFLLFF